MIWGYLSKTDLQTYMNSPEAFDFKLEINKKVHSNNLEKARKQFNRNK